MTQVIVNGLTMGALYSVVAVGFGLIYFTTRHFHLAHGAVVTLGAYAGYLVTNASPSSWLPPALTAAIVGAAAGCVMEWALYRPFSRRSASSEVVLIASLAVYILTVNIIALLGGNQTRLLRSGAAATFLLGDAVVTVVQGLHVAAAAGTALGLLIVLRWSRIGREWRCVADDAALASLLGLNTDVARLSVFAAGSALAGLGGYLIALDVGMNPHMGFDAVLAAIVSCIIGGMGKYLAPVLGALVLGITQALVVGYVSSRWKTAVTYALLLLFLGLLPQGLLGRRRRVEEKRSR